MGRGGNDLVPSAQHHASEMLKDNPSAYLPCFLPSDGSGIYDLVKEATDAIGHLDRQQREDITQSAQV